MYICCHQNGILATVATCGTQIDVNENSIVALYYGDNSESSGIIIFISL